MPSIPESTAETTKTPQGRGLPWCWGADDADIAATGSLDGALDSPTITLWRAVDVEAAADILYRWLCQLRVAPYSYDLLDNFGRRSPRTLTPGADWLEIGQRMMVFRITDFQPGRSITGLGLPAANRLFGRLACVYLARPVDDRRSRLVARLDVGVDGPIGRVRSRLLAWGDLVMMRKQLLTLKSLAEGGVDAEQVPADRDDGSSAVRRAAGSPRPWRRGRPHGS